MPLDTDTIEALGLGLAKARQTGAVVGLPLDRIQSLDDAQAVQLEAFEAMDEPCCGVTALSLNAAAMADPSGTVISVLSKERIFDPAASFALPWGLLGMRCALLFTSAKVFPAPQTAGNGSAEEAMGRCELAVELLGRRVPGAQKLNAYSATADFGLHVATFPGPVISWPVISPPLDPAETEEPIVIHIDGNIVGRLDFAGFIRLATDELRRLALGLVSRDQKISVGDLVTVGTPLPALQVLSGQHLRVDFGGLGSVAVHLG